MHHQNKLEVHVYTTLKIAHICGLNFQSLQYLIPHVNLSIYTMSQFLQRSPTKNCYIYLVYYNRHRSPVLQRKNGYNINLCSVLCIVSNYFLTIYKDRVFA